MDKIIEMPESFNNSKKLQDSWNYYKDYLTELRHPFVNQESEDEEKEKLFFLSDQNVDSAIKLLNKIMAGGYFCI